MFVSKRVFQVVFIAFAIYGAYLASGDFDVFDAAGYFPPGIVRLRVLELQNGGNSSDVALIAAGLICVSIYQDNQTITVEFQDRTIANQTRSLRLRAGHMSNCQPYHHFMIKFFFLSKFTFSLNQFRV